MPFWIKVLKEAALSLNEGVFLSHTESYKFQIITKYLNGKLYRDEAAKLLNVSLRTVSRYAKRIKENGIFRAKHGNHGNTHNKKYSEELKQSVLQIKTENYYDFNTVHFHEILASEFNIKIPYTVLWRWLDKEKLVKRRHQRRRKKHVYRPRMPQEGLLLQMDGSHHRFNGKDEWCLISAIDDATSEIPYAEFFEGETTLGCMKVLKKIIEIKGVPKAIYTDRAGWSGGQKRTQFSNFQEVCERLGIKVLYANSPEAKGRIERSFRTIQDRLVPELRRERIKSMEKANQYLQDKFLPEYWNKKNVVKPLNPESAFEPLVPWINLENTLCLTENRAIAPDQTVSFQGQRYIVHSDLGSLAGYYASFKTTIEGELKVFVQGREVQIEPTSTRHYNDEGSGIDFKISDRGIYKYMYRAASNTWGAVWKHKVTGKPLKLPNKKRAS